MLVSVFGLGYIGLPTAAILASRKIPVVGVDINPTIIDTVNRGEIHFVEPELDIIVHAAVSEGFLRSTLQPEPADVFIIAVPTPILSSRAPDLAYVKMASETIAPLLKPGNLIILESTSPVGTTHQVARWMADLRPDLKFPFSSEEPEIHLAYCPERVLPGRVLHELVQNDRIIGGLTSQCSEKALALYKTFVAGKCIVTTAQTAEMCKLTENSFRDVNIAFANELSMICDQLDINVWELIQLANRHPRVNILQPGPGVGGHCIAVDPWFIVHSAPEQARLIAAARDVNERKTAWVIKKVDYLIDDYLTQHREKQIDTLCIACFGIAFKANIDDLRESPALNITQALASRHLGKICIVEPNITRLPPSLESNAELCDINNALLEADIVIILVDHREFKKINQERWKNHAILDVRGVLFQGS